MNPRAPSLVSSTKGASRSSRRPSNGVQEAIAPWRSSMLSHCDVKGLLKSAFQLSEGGDRVLKKKKKARTWPFRSSGRYIWALFAWFPLQNSWTWSSFSGEEMQRILWLPQGLLSNLAEIQPRESKCSSVWIPVHETFVCACKIVSSSDFC